MDMSKDPEFLAALRALFVTRDDIKTVVEYQQRLYASLHELDNNHRAVHQHVRSLTESHNAVRTDANELIRQRNELSSALRDLAEAHKQTRSDMRRAAEAITYVQEQTAKMPELEMRLRLLEQAQSATRRGVQAAERNQ